MSDSSNQIVEGTPGGAAYLVHGRTLIALQPPERTIEMHVGGVNEFHQILPE